MNRTAGSECIVDGKRYEVVDAPEFRSCKKCDFFTIDCREKNIKEQRGECCKELRLHKDDVIFKEIQVDVVV